jgi:ketosteroid isomerase-like protein
MFPNQSSEWRPADSPPTPPTSEPAPIPPTSEPAPIRRAGSGRYASLAAPLLAVAVFGGLIGFAADRWVTSTSTSSQPPVAASAPTPASVPRVGPVAAQNGPATDPQQQAIQQLIEKGDQEQAQALAANDPTVMSDTSTPDFYQQQVSTNQDLRANGVSAIKLVNIEWGQIAVNGPSATATAWETWSTTYSDGTTEQSRDRNVYTLTQDNDQWKVSADEHPDEALVGNGGGGGVPGAVSPGVGPGGSNPGTGRQPSQPSPPTQPARPRGQTGQARNTSQNWSGYAASGGTYSAVSGTWTVPQFTPDSGAGADATWVGIGGVNSRDLIQAGTQQTVSGSGSTQYEAWVETLPQASHPVSLTVNPGDSVTVAITQQPQASDQWVVAFTNNTTGQRFQVTEQYTSSMSSAEWIEEAPSAARGRQLPLDNFGSINFSAASAVKDGKSVSIAESGAQAITMIGRGSQTQATPSTLGADGSSFTISRT